MTHATRVGVRTAVTVLAQVLTLSGLAACSSSDQPGASSSAAPSASAASSSSPVEPPSPSASSSSSPAEPPSPSGSASPSDGSDSVKTVTITIKDFEYSDVSSVAAGTKITVKNQDSVAHTVTADEGGAFDVSIAPGGSATFSAPSSAGSYAFHCTYHANMHGTLTVS